MKSDLVTASSCLSGREYNNINISNPSMIIDAGANIGASTICFARRYPSATIFAIEPERENFSLLLRNISGFKNIIPIKAALWGQEEIKVLPDQDTGPWGYTITDTSRKAVPTSQMVEYITVGSLLAVYKLQRVDILKMNIEGGEENVFENSDSWINKVTVITAELHDRICMGCDRAFYLATREFARFERCGEKVTAYRE